MSSNFVFQIGSYKYYASKVLEWNPIGVPAFGNDGRPLPYGLGNFSVLIHGMPYKRPSGVGGPIWPDEPVDIATTVPVDEGSYVDLKASWANALGSFIQVYVSSPSDGGAWQTINCRMSFPTILGYINGRNLVDVQVSFPGAFLPDDAVASYTGGYVVVFDTGSSTDPPYIPGDPVPPPEPGVNYYFGNGVFGHKFFGRGDGA